MGTEVLTEVIKQLPVVAALIYIVVEFLKHIAKSEERREKQEERRDQQSKLAEAECRAFQVAQDAKHDLVSAKQATIIDRNTEAFFRYTAIMERIEDMLDRAPATTSDPSQPNTGSMLGRKKQTGIQQPPQP